MMDPGRELDELVAERVMGVEHWKAYSTDIAAAWEVVERMCELFPERPLRIGRRWGMGGMHQNYDVDFGTWWDADAVDTAIRVRGKTAPHAICLAALEAVSK